MKWRTPEGKEIYKRRIAVWEAVCNSPVVRKHLGEDWCEKWQELDRKLMFGAGHQLADELICMAGIVRMDN
jgi:hypothetical protein